MPQRTSKILLVRLTANKNALLFQRRVTCFACYTVWFGVTRSDHNTVNDYFTQSRCMFNMRNIWFHRASQSAMNTMHYLTRIRFALVLQIIHITLHVKVHFCGICIVMLVRERATGTKLEGDFKKKKGVLMEQSNHTITFLPAGRSEGTIISKRYVGNWDQQPCCSKWLTTKETPKTQQQTNPREMPKPEEVTTPRETTVTEELAINNAPQQQMNRPIRVKCKQNEEQTHSQH